MNDAEQTALKLFPNAESSLATVISNGYKVQVFFGEHDNNKTLDLYITDTVYTIDRFGYKTMITV